MVEFEILHYYIFTWEKDTEQIILDNMDETISVGFSFYFDSIFLNGSQNLLV